jgi:hypothetical protein
MVTKIYVRERLKVGKGVKEPRFRVVAATYGVEETPRLKISAFHFRKSEIEQIAKDAGAEIIYLKQMPEEEQGKRKEK